MSELAPVTHGVTDRAAHIGEFRLTETSHAPHTRLGRHSHAYPAITLVLTGGFSEDFGGDRVHECAAMSALVKPAGAPHTNRYSRQGARSFILECTGASATGRALHACSPQFGVARLTMPMLELYAAFRASAPERALLAEEVALAIGTDGSIEAASSTARRPRWLATVAEAIAASCTTPLRLTSLAASVDVHPVYLARVFRRHYGRSVGAYTLECRVRMAMCRLATTAEPVSRIALDCGFTDQPHFTRQFHREAGVPPARFRRVARGRLSPA